MTCFDKLADGLKRHPGWIIFGIGGAIRIAQILASHPRPDRAQTELELVARSLALHGSFADPYLHPTGPTAHVAPGIPALIALIYMFFGVGWVGELAKRILGALVCTAQYALLPRVSEALGIPRPTGIIAGLAASVALYKGFVETAADAWEQPYVALALVLLFLHTLRTWSTPQSSGTAAVVRGFWWGAATLISPILGLVFAAVVLYEVSALKRTAQLAALLVGFTATQTPWLVRNWIQLHGFVPSRSNFGLEFQISNGPDSFPLMEDNVTHGVMARFHPSVNAAESQMVREAGEIAYNRSKLREVEAEIRGNPGHFLHLTLERIWRFWLQPSRRTKSTLATTLILLLGAAGLCILPPGPGIRLVWLILLSYPLVYYVIEIDRRYRYPIEWIFIPPAVHVLAVASRRVALQLRTA